MTPAHRHANPPPIVDGDVYPAPPRPPAPRINRAQVWEIGAVAVLVLALMVYGIVAR
ncbi:MULTISPECIES: hypothetical protein [unclassified Micromonospora]|uniref:hypothetical protein n=1 Tax=unclassified Micromonospora TaxID=2617518 RepID=UPI00140528DF|nr:MULTISPECIES: hypothetical protein [unclassified Micromonospora]